MNLAMLLADSAAGTANTGSSIMVIVVYIVVIGAFFYFIMLRPQKKEQKRVNAMLAELATGDAVMTSGGFYGTVIDITEDTVIVEFGNNKNCRIPMQKSSIVQVEKDDE